MSSPENSQMPRVNTRSLNDVMVWINREKESGNLRHCGNLTIDHTQWASGTVFLPECKANSFEWPQGVPNAQIFEKEALIKRLHQQPICCPKHCLNYTSAWQ